MTEQQKPTTAERAALLHYLDNMATSVIASPDKKAIYAEIVAAIRSDMAEIERLRATPQPSPQRDEESTAQEAAPVATVDLMKRAAFFGWQRSDWNWQFVAGAMDEANPDFHHLQPPPAAPVADGTERLQDRVRELESLAAVRLQCVYDMKEIVDEAHADAELALARIDELKAAAATDTPASAVAEPLRKAAAHLMQMARTSGGVAGRDEELCAACDAVQEALAAPPPIARSDADDGKSIADAFEDAWYGKLHPDTRYLVAAFANALAEKLAAAEEKYGYTDGWADKGWMDECRAQLIEHVVKGDPRDVAAFDDAKANAVYAIRCAWIARVGGNVLERARSELAGRNLACWCTLDAPCHADVLLEIANR
jgi:hypothetical protein